MLLLFFAAMKAPRVKWGRRTGPVWIARGIVTLLLRLDDLHRRRRSGPFVAGHRLDAAAEALAEEAFGAGVEVDRVLGAGEAVALVRVDDVRHAAVVLLDRVDDLLRLRVIDARIVRP